MAEYVDRYDVGSLESTERQYSDFQIVKRLMTDYIFKPTLAMRHCDRTSCN